MTHEEIAIKLHTLAELYAQRDQRSKEKASAHQQAVPAEVQARLTGIDEAFATHEATVQAVITTLEAEIKKLL
jgi:hypothetical protein